ncbi:uncharacterized protein LOC131170244 [Hevea brasiliensis]|uniref:uncharacterized protein LOC131170244 n=1 Tax=Hevea brasiliensis TaxID=3981 RepID=UPI0025D0BB40|nr:uncharacterized protein LOC131170244 [Hevea brasiliensis]
MFMTALVLSLPSGNKDFNVFYDAIRVGLECVLIQNGKVIAYALRATIVFALQMWRHYLYKAKCEIFTDYRSLQYIFNQKELNLKQRKWFGSHINAKVTHFEGATITNRRVVTVGIINKRHIDGTDESGTDVLKRGDDIGLKGDIMREAHNVMYSVHPGATKMYQDLKKVHWWPSMKKEIAQFMSAYEVCQRMKLEHQKLIGTVYVTEIVRFRGALVTIVSNKRPQFTSKF